MALVDYILYPVEQHIQGFLQFFHGVIYYSIWSRLSIFIGVPGCWCLISSMITMIYLPTVEFWINAPTHVSAADDIQNSLCLREWGLNHWIYCCCWSIVILRRNDLQCNFFYVFLRGKMHRRVYAILFHWHSISIYFSGGWYSSQVIGIPLMWCLMFLWIGMLLICILIP